MWEGLEGRKEKEKWCNYIAISKLKEKQTKMVKESKLFHSWLKFPMLSPNRFNLIATVSYVFEFFIVIIFLGTAKQKWFLNVLCISFHL